MERRPVSRLVKQYQKRSVQFNKAASLATAASGVGTLLGAAKGATLAATVIAGSGSVISGALWYGATEFQNRANIATNAHDDGLNLAELGASALRPESVAPARRESPGRLSPAVDDSPSRADAAAPGSSTKDLLDQVKAAVDLHNATNQNQRLQAPRDEQDVQHWNGATTHSGTVLPLDGGKAIVSGRGRFTVVEPEQFARANFTGGVRPARIAEQAQASNQEVRRMRSMSR